MKPDAKGAYLCAVTFYILMHTLALVVVGLYENNLRRYFETLSPEALIFITMKILSTYLYFTCHR